MEVTQHLPIAGTELKQQLMQVIALWLALTFTLALALTLFLP
ncbi:hypothetical protein ACFQJ7_16160 [Halovenus rubra]|uniref:Uncharacterized protein n=2 Tax=Halovenus rubra TaxID=869890 RepID=A0ACC7E4C7_9EURY|nr:hypothetical protein [Halovenus rubra]